MCDEHEHSFVQRLAAGDSDCLTRVLERLRPKLLRLLAKRIPPKLNRRVDAEDIVQNALISFTMRVREHAYQFDEIYDAEHLLVTIALNTLRKAEREEHSARRDVYCEDSDIDDSPIVQAESSRRDGIDPHGDPLEQVIASDLLDKVQQMFAEEKDQAIVRFWSEGYTVEEIAHKVDCSPRHVEQVHAKARRRLEELEQDR